MRISDKIYIKPYSLMEIKKGNKFQWIKGDNFGDIEIVKEDSDDKKVEFESGRIILRPVFKEFLKPIEKDGDAVVVQKIDPNAKPAPNHQTVTNTAPAQEVETALTITKNKIGSAIEKSKINTVLEFKIQLKYLDSSLYDFLKDNQENFDEVYEDLLFEQLARHAKNELKVFINKTYPINSNQ